jgi:hypothetical protein
MTHYDVRSCGNASHEEELHTQLIAWNQVRRRLALLQGSELKVGLPLREAGEIEELQTSVSFGISLRRLDPGSKSLTSARTCSGARAISISVVI